MNISAVLVPVIPNAPLLSLKDKQNLGEIRLRKNLELDFVENARFQASAMHYDASYQNSQAHSSYFFEHMVGVLNFLKFQLPKNSKVVEVGCGKGDFVELLNNDGYFSAVGYDSTYEGESEKIFKRYLSSKDKVEADLVVLRHVLEHLERPHEFLLMIRGVFTKCAIYIEVPSYDWIIKSQAFFDITYEHVNYFSQTSLSFLFDASATLQGSSFGGQYQYVFSRIESLSEQFSENYRNGSWEYLDFYNLFPEMDKTITGIVEKLGPTNSVYVWGAATKGCMFLAHCKNLNLLIDKINFAIDINPGKHGKYLPYSGVPIKSKEEFFKVVKNGDFLLITNPNYKDEIMQDLDRSAVEGLNILCL